MTWKIYVSQWCFGFIIMIIAGVKGYVSRYKHFGIGMYFGTKQVAKFYVKTMIRNCKEFDGNNIILLSQ